MNNPDLRTVVSDYWQKHVQLTARNQHTSFSHSAERLAWAVGNTPVGFDIEKKQHRTTSLFSYLCSEQEKMVMLRHHQDATIAQLWAWVIKEACYKVGQGSGEPSSFQIDNYSGAQAEVSSESGHTFQVECFELPEDYVAALAHSNVTTAL